MALPQITTLFGYPLTDPWNFFYQSLYDGNLQPPTTSEIVVISDAGNTIVFKGSFTVVGGDVTGGTMTGFAVYAGSSKVMKADGYSVAGDALFDALQTFQVNNDSFFGLLFGQALKVVGSKEDDDLAGTEANDIVVGRAGNDELFGSTGDDLLKGGKGNDLLFGGDGYDTMFGGRATMSSASTSTLRNPLSVTERSRTSSPARTAWNSLSPVSTCLRASSARTISTRAPRRRPPSRSSSTTRRPVGSSSTSTAPASRPSSSLPKSRPAPSSKPTISSSTTSSRCRAPRRPG